MVLNQFSLQQRFEPRLLQPYTALRFILRGEKTSANKSKETAAIIIVVELSIQPLVVNYPNQIYLAKLNKNDDLQVDISYEGDPDQYSLFLSLFYKLEVVATKKQNFTSFSFQIWDLFSSFDYDSAEVLLRVSLYDPRFFMPSISTANINVNFEPLGGELVIAPASGYSLETDFVLSATGFFDEDSPLTYRFFYYQDEDLYELERGLGVSPVNSRRDFLAESGLRNELSIRIPMGRQSQSMDVLIMVSVIDSLGAVTNVTQKAKVSPRHPTSFDEQVIILQSFYQNSILNQVQPISRL